MPFVSACVKRKHDDYGNVGLGMSLYGTGEVVCGICLLLSLQLREVVVRTGN